jgi:hypothetical protein
MYARLYRMVEMLTSPKLETELEGHITSHNLIHHSYNNLRYAGSYVVYCCYYLSWCNSLCVPLEDMFMLMMHCL